MTRAEAKQNLITIGIEEPTEEQITNYLNQVGGETKKYKTDAERLKELEKENESLKNANLTDLEKSTKDLEKAQERIAELERVDALRTKRENAMSKWKISKEQASQVFKDDGSFDDDALATIISEKETASAKAKEDEIAKGSFNPGGGSAGGTGKPEKTDAEKLAEAIGKSLSASNEESKTIIESYT